MEEPSVLEILLKRELFYKILKSKGIDAEKLEKEVDEEFQRIVKKVEDHVAGRENE